MRTAEERRRIVKQETTVAGLAIVAADTGRVLMLQRGLEEGDPAAGMWEFPGGHIENGETPLQGAFREWSEETGVKLTAPDSDSELPSWKNGIYQGFVYEVPSEASVNIFDRAEGTNPDDPDGDMVEALAWWSPDLLKRNPAVRAELRASLNVVLPAIEQEERTLNRRRISKHGHKGEAGYELLHPGKGKAFEAANKNPDVLKWDYAKFQGETMHNSFESRGGDHSYKITSTPNGNWKVVSDGKILQGSYAHENDAATAAQKLHNIRTGKDLPAIHDAATAEGMKKLGVTNSVPKVNVNDGKSEKHVVAPGTPKSAVKQAEKDAGKVEKPAMMNYNPKLDEAKHLAESKLDWTDKAHSSSAVSPNHNHGQKYVVLHNKDKSEFLLNHPENSDGSPKAPMSTHNTLEDAKFTAEAHAASMTPEPLSALEWGGQKDGIQSAGATGLNGASDTPLKNDQTYIIVPRSTGEEAGKYSVAATHNSLDFYNSDGTFKTFNSEAEAKKAAEEHYMNGGHTPPKNELNFSTSGEDKVSSKLPNGQGYVVSENLSPKGTYGIGLLKPEQYPLDPEKDIELQDFPTKLDAMKAAQAHASALDIKLEDHQYNLGKQGAEGAAAANKIIAAKNPDAKNKLDFEYKTPNSTSTIIAKNPIGNGDYRISSAMTDYKDPSSIYYKTTSPDAHGKLHENFAEAVQHLQGQVNEGKHFDDPNDQHMPTIGDHSFGVINSGKASGEKKIQMYSKVPGTSNDYYVQGELQSGKYTVTSPHDGSKLGEQTFPNIVAAQQAARNEDVARLAAYRENLSVFKSDNPWKQIGQQKTDLTLVGDNGHHVFKTYYQGEGYGNPFRMTYEGPTGPPTAIGQYKTLQDAVDVADAMASDTNKYGFAFHQPSPSYMGKAMLGDNKFTNYAEWSVPSDNEYYYSNIRKVVADSGVSYNVWVNGGDPIETSTLAEAKQVAANARGDVHELGPAFLNFKADKNGHITEASSKLFLATKEPDGTFSLQSKSEDMGGKYNNLGNHLRADDVKFKTGSAMIQAMADGSQWTPQETNSYNSPVTNSDKLFHNWYSTIYENKSNPEFVVQHDGTDWGHWGLYKKTSDEYGDSEFHKVDSFEPHSTLVSATETASKEIDNITAADKAAAKAAFEKAQSIPIPTHETLGNFHDMGRAPDEHAMTQSPEAMKFLTEFDHHDLNNNRGEIKDKIATRVSSLMLAQIQSDPELVLQWNQHMGYHRNDDGEFPAISPKDIYHYVDSKNRAWAGTSGDHDAEAIAVQIQAARTFGLQNQHIEGLDQTTVSHAEDYIKSEGKLIDVFLQNTYRNTQLELKERGVPETVTLYRGMRFESHTVPAWVSGKTKGDSKRITNAVMNPLTSWSADRQTSENFANGSGGYSVLMTASIPRESIYASARTGQGCASEFEYVVVGGKGTTYAKIWGHAVAEGPVRIDPNAPEHTQGWTKLDTTNNNYTKAIDGKTFGINNYYGEAGHHVYHNGTNLGEFDSLEEAQKFAHDYSSQPEAVKNWTTLGPDHMSKQINGVTFAIDKSDPNDIKVYTGGNKIGMSHNFTSLESAQKYAKAFADLNN